LWPGINVTLVLKFPNTQRFIGLLWFTLFNVSLQAADSSVLFSDDSASKAKIDWTKPIVSRGFGYEATTDKDKLFQNEYQQGQIAYFFGDHTKALTIWTTLAEKNHGQSQASLAWLYHAGLGTEKNLEMAFRLYQAAAKQNNPIAQNNLGTMYENGVYVDLDLKQAQSLYKLSAENGYRFGQYNYANALYEGWEGKADKASARDWYQKSADQNVKQAKDKLQSMDE